MTRKKVLPIILVTLIIFSTMVATVSQAFIGSIYGDFRYTVNDDDTITINAYTGNSAEPDIPEKIHGKTITDKAVISTSIDHGVASCFGTGDSSGF